MKLIKFRIQRYKSIKDSGWCWLASDITTLAGKNESGKSAILEALRDFNLDVKTWPDGAVPIDDSGKPMIEMCFGEVEESVLDEIVEETKIPISGEVREYISKNNVTIIKYDNCEYGLDEEIKTLLNKEREDLNSKSIKKIEQVVGNLSEIEWLSDITKPELDDDIAPTRKRVDSYIIEVEAQVAWMSDEETELKVNEAIEELKSANEALDEEDVASKFVDELVRHTPDFIFFRDFSDILPFELPLAEAKNRNIVQDFAKVSGLDLDKVINTPDSQQRRNILSTHSANISGNFKNHWKQDELDLIAELDGETLRLGVKESDGHLLFKSEQRSKGFQWFLSFYLRLNAADQSRTRIILIDEPGLYLHAKAQEDILKELEKISEKSLEKSPVIISTHSPYLIDSQRLDRVRLIVKDDQSGTRIENKIHKDTDTETLTPIITAIGLDISKGFSIAGKKNVLLEGISDYYFIQALRKDAKINKANFIPCVGAQKIPQLASLLIGWDLEFLVVLDSDSQGKKIAKELGEKLLIEQDRIIFISERNEFSIEDLFTHDDFNAYVLEETKNDDATTSNSKFLKSKKLDKVLLAKKFFEKMRHNRLNGTLSEETIRAFRGVFEKIEAGLEDR